MRFATTPNAPVEAYTVQLSIQAGSNKSRTLGKILNIPVFATTQNKSRLGETCEELGLDSPDGISTKVHADKTAFSMWYGV